MILNDHFYLNDDVVSVAKNLIGKILCSNINGEITSGVIQETEAYNGINDRASHAFGGRFTERTKVMYAKGGIAYVYLCYGIHHLFNVVTNIEGTPHAVLIRGLIPLRGKQIMIERTMKKNLVLNGPGKLTKALGICLAHNYESLSGSIVWIEDKNIDVDPDTIEIGPRIGVDYAGADATLPYRFVWGFNENPDILF